MTDDSNFEKHQDEVEESRRMHIRVFGNEADIPEHVSRGLLEKTAQWVIPALAIVIVLYGVGSMISSVIEAYKK